MSSQRIRTGSAWLILSVFLLGGFVGPLTHLFYMAVSDVFVPVGTVAEHVSSSGSGHDASMHAVASTPDGVALDSQGEAHFVCDYAALFATPVTADLVEVTSIAPASLDTDYISTPLLSVAENRPQSESARGPPVESTTV